MIRIIPVAIILSLVAMGLQSNALEIKNYEVEIESLNDTFKVTENIEIERENDTSVLIWIQEEAENVEIKMNGTKVNYSKSGNIYMINLINSSSIKLDINYKLPSPVQFFMKNILYKCDFLSIKLDGKIVYEGTNISKSSYFFFSVKKEVVEKGNYYIYVTLILLITLISILAYSLMAKRRTKNIVVDDPDILKTKKELLMSILKELEKKYRAKEVNEEVYNKLKDFYKRETVNIIRRLEEIEKT